ncbi:DNA alkylation repair protein [Paenibacillus sp. NEAU-GSW1]|uniref:DNA alkylation repair protein n=1 Tax=Paenibacillus sp. NEAU-GSW1 TaxID=2682486 RepID=UPI0012E21DDE|nr:DNA alkylation repair protein [Paenibacillus sp. NEAU-GSW1]MUT65751.1 DNA alkylation repair protein [Paenibacillus sp. NEAU-GSW1]
MSDYIEKIAACFRANADRNKAEAMEAYMRGQFPFLGIKTPERTKLLHDFWQTNGVPQGEELLQAVRELWLLPEREFQNVAMAHLDKHVKRADKLHIDLLEQLVLSKSWWDTVDYIAAHLIGRHLSKYPELITDYPDRWIESDHMWLRRTAILFQLKYKGRTDTLRLFGYIERCKEEKDFFIRKAIGWALREYAKTDAEAVKRFVASTELSPLSVREALKNV